MQDIRICTVVLGKTKQDFLKNLREVQKISDFIELRVDYIKNVTIDDIKEIKICATKKTIFTCGRREEGGMFERSEEERIELIKAADILDFDYIDIELASIDGVDLKTKKIISFHDFEKTPSRQTLEEVKRAMKKYGNSIMKFA